MEVAEQNSCLRAGNEQDYEDQEEEAKHVIHLMRPNAVEDEEKLDKDAAEGQNATHDDARHRFGEE